MDRQLTQLIIIIIIISYFLFAAGPYEILNLSHNARSLALNNTTSAYGGPFLQNNPASISMRTDGMSYSYLSLPANIHLGEIHYISKKNKGVRAAKIALLNYGSFLDSETNNESYAFDALIEMGYKRELKNIISVGISCGYIFSSIAGFNSQVLFSNMGVRSRLLRKRMGIGFSLENMGILLKSYTDAKESIPALLRTSFYYKPMYIPLIINGDIVRKLDDNLFYLSSGFELISQRRLTFRLGLNSNRSDYLTGDSLSDILLGISGGIGFRFQKITLDIGFMNLGFSGYVVGFSISSTED